MPHDTDSTPSAGLRTRLTALGAKPHSRMSDLSRYMLDHYEELQALVAEGFAWAAITGLLANEEQLVDKRGKPITAELAKLTWSRTMARRRGVATPRAADQDHGQRRGGGRACGRGQQHGRSSAGPHGVASGA
jgi:hypothetical protein